MKTQKIELYNLRTDFDEGPIISQKTTPVNHSLSLKDLVKAGRENETSPLAQKRCN